MKHFLILNFAFLNKLKRISSSYGRLCVMSILAIKKYSDANWAFKFESMEKNSENT